MNIAKRSNIIWHIAGSLVFLFFALLASPDWPYPERTFNNPMGRTDLIFQLELLIIFYVNYYFLLDKFYFAKKQVLYFIIIFIVLLISVPLMEHLVLHSMHHGEGHFRRPGPPGERSPVSMFLFNRKLYLFLLVIIGSLLIKFRARFKKIEQEKTITELSFLKAQINPHFLFNTLNSIYSLAIQRSEATPDAVVKLSGMMRYVLYEAQHEMVPLEAEVNYIKDFIELQRLRLENSVKFSFSVSGDFTGRKIAPLILISFVENAFKYGVNSEENSDIKIAIGYNKQLVFTVTNNKVSSVLSQNENGGLGIKNTKKRLELLYPDAHLLKITETEEVFSVNLVIQLK